MRKTLLMLILAMAGIFASQAQVLKKHQMSAPAPSGVKASIEAGTNQMWWGYVNAEDEYGGLGVGASDTYYCAIFIPGTNAALLNKTISAVRFAMVSENAQSVSVWVSKTLPESISTKTVDELVPVDDVQVGINDVALSKAHKITSDGLYIGYTFRIPDVKDVNDAYPICITDGEPAINTLLLRTSKAITSWQNTTAYGRLYLQVLLNGSIAYQNAASPAGMEDVMLGINTEGTALMPVTNLGSEPITSIEYSVKAKTTTKASLEFASPIMFGNTSYVSIPLTGDETFGTSTRTITINKVNGKSNQAPTADKSVKITVTTLVRVVQRGIVMEEFTGTGCGWCPRGLVGMEKLRAKYGNQFIGVAYHSYNGGYSDAMYIPSSSYTLSFAGAPSCHLQRAFGEIDPYYGTGSDIVSDCEAVISTPALADVQVVGEWNEDKTAINATATIEGVGGDGNYQIIYALIADGLTGEGSMWAQSNYYNGQTGLPQDMAFLTDAGSSYYPVFNDVCIATSIVNGANKATDPGKIQLGQTVTNTYTIDMPAKDNNHAELYEALDYGKVAVVAMLIDKSTGIIENAMKFYMAPQTNPDDPELQAPEGWNSLIANGNLAGDDVSSFFSKEYPSTAIVGSAIFEGAGFNNSRGIIVKAQDKAAEAWDSQFFIRFNETLPEGTMLHVEFDYKADKAASIGTQAHGEPGAYKHWAAIGNVNFTPEWQHFSVNVTVEGAMADMQTIAFNLNDLAEANNYYFDNFGIWMQKPAPVEDWVNILANSELEGTDVSAFFSKEAPSTEVVPSTIYDGAGVDGSRGIKVTSIAGAAQDWDTQFWIYMPCVLPEGTKYLVEFDYKADKDATADTQAHGEPGNYIFYSMIGSPSFTTEWQHYSKSGTISADQAGDGTFRSIAFNLSKDRANDVTFFFDNIKVFVEKSFADENLPAVAPVPDGKYYIMCASEEGDWFMSAGHNWGTRAIIDNTGLDLELVYDAPSGTYTIETGVYNNATNHFLGENLYMDSPAFGWKIEQTSSITFTISNGTQYIGIDHDFNLALSDTPAEWAFIDAAYLQQARFAEGMESLKAASMDNGVDATFLLKDPQFNRNDHRWEAWTVSENCTNKNLGGGCDGNSGNGCAESWHSAFTISQLVEGAPAGFYALTAQGFYRQDDEMEEPAPYFFIGDATGLVPERTGTENSMTEAGNSFEQGLYTIEPIMFLLNEDGQFTVGITNGENLHQWVIWDNFKLTYFGMPVDDPVLEAPEGWTSIIGNGNLAGDDVANFFSKEAPAGEPSPSVIKLGAGKNGSRGINVQSADSPAQGWDTQFFIRFNEKLPEGTLLHVEFDYKADKNASASTQSHTEPGTYIHWAAIGTVNFTPEWQHYSADVTVSAEMNDMQTIAFNLAEETTATLYSFDNFGIWMQKPAPVEDWVNILANSEMEGTDVSAFFSKEAPSTEVVPSTIYDGAGVDGSRGIKVTSIAGAAQDWDTQFWIYMPCVLPEGTKYLVEFDYKADKDATADTQAHGEPGNYIFYSMIGSPSFTTEWQHYSKSGTISADQAGGGTFRSIAFNLSKDRENDVTFFFDNIKVFVEKSFADENLNTLPEADFADGKYILVNTASEKAWGAGNSWGTQATLVDHPEYVTLLKQPDGTYFMESQVSNGGESYYFNGDYMDQTPPLNLTIKTVSLIGENAVDGSPVYVYTISNGDNYFGWDGETTVLGKNLPADSENALWIIASIDDAVAGLAAATADDPMDATFLFLDPNFGRNNRNKSAWTGDDFGVGGDNSNMNAEKWGGNSQTFDISQTAEVPNGTYIVTWNGFYRYNNTEENTNDVAIAAHADGSEVINSFVYLNDEDYPLTSIADEDASEALNGALPFSQADASAAFGQGLYEQSAKVVVTDGQLTIGIKKTEHMGTDWTVWDNFRVSYLGEISEMAEGTCYLQNVGTEKFLAAGHSWGTRSIVNEVGLDFTLTKTADGKYTIDSQVSNGGDSHFLGTNLFVDAPAAGWTIEAAGDGFFTISNENGYLSVDDNDETVQVAEVDQNALWAPVSLEERVAFFDVAADPVDATFLLKDANFNRNDLRKSFWQGDDFGVGGDATNTNAEKWGGNSQTFDIYQTIDVPNGVYSITWNGFYRYNNTEDNTNDVAIAAHADGSEVINSFVYLNDEDYPLTSIADEDASEALNGALPFSQADASAAFGQGLYEQSAKVVVTDGQLTIGIKKTEHMGTDWTVWDNFRLTYLGEGDDNVLDLAIKHERQIGLGYTPTEATVDFTEAKAFLGVDEVTTSMLSFENPDGSLIPYADYMAANYDGWCNGEGAAENWGANTKICVKFFEAIPNGTFTFYDMNGADEVGATYSVKWRLTNDEKSVRYTVNVKFIEKPVIELNFADLNQLGNGVVVPFTSEVGSCYEGFNADVDVPAILGTLGAGSLDEVMIYAVQSDGSLDDNYKLGTTDGWRNAAGDWQGWGADAFFYVKANFAAESSQLYEVGGMDPNMNPAMNTPATYTATYAFVKKGTKDAVVLKVTLTYPDPDELIVNGTCEGEDAGCLLSKNGDGDGGFIWNPLAGAGIDGSTCAVVHATGTAANEWDAQFFIFAKDHVFTEGEKYKVTMWIKADNAAANSAQAHTTPGNYKHWRVISDGSPIQFTTEWTEFVYEGVIDADLDGIQTIAFNLNTDKTLENNYYFDNISWKIIREENGIETVETVNVEVEGIYNLRGQKVDKPTKKGVYIINGRKVVVK